MDSDAVDQVCENCFSDVPLTLVRCKINEMCCFVCETTVDAGVQEVLRRFGSAVNPSLVETTRTAEELESKEAEAEAEACTLRGDPVDARSNEEI